MIKPNKSDLYSRIRTILESARTNIARSVNSTQVVANWLVGREIVIEEQSGKIKAEYGERVLKDLASLFSTEYGNGYSGTNLRWFRQFYCEYPDLLEGQIHHAVRDKLGTFAIPHAVRGKSDDLSWKPGQLNQNLSWTHYRTLLKVRKKKYGTFMK